jgi:hypothetical protein
MGGWGNAPGIIISGALPQAPFSLPSATSFHMEGFCMSVHVRICLIVSLMVTVALAYSPASFADKRGNSNSSTGDDKKDKDNDNQSNQRGGRGRDRNDGQKSSNEQFKTIQKGGYKNQDSDSQPKTIIGNPTQGNQFQKSQQLQNLQTKQPQNSQKQIFQPQNNQQQSSKSKWQDQNDKNHKDVHNWVQKFGGPEPFSKQWYKDHPKAWHHEHHDHDDAWKVVTAAGVIGFLGWEMTHPRTVVVYEPVPYDTLFVSRPGVVIDVTQGDWMPLGVFSLMVGPGDESTRMLDLAIDRHGNIRGSYYDMVSNASYNVAGVVDARTQYAQWSLESNRGLTFYTPLGEMMQPQGVVTVRLPSGQRQQWQLVRMEGGGY